LTWAKVRTKTPYLSCTVLDRTGVPEAMKTSKSELYEDTEQRPGCNRLDMVRGNRAGRTHIHGIVLQGLELLRQVF